MGRVIHDAIVVTSWSGVYASLARQRALELGLPVTELATADINGVCSFMIAPDGSNAGWAQRDQFENLRRQWVEWARDARARADAGGRDVPHGGAFFDWVHLRYGEVAEPGSKDAIVVQHGVGGALAIGAPLVDSRREPESKSTWQCWEVRMWWRTDDGKLFESAVNTGWPVGTGSMQVLHDAATMRGVDLAKCHNIDAVQIGEPYELSVRPA